MPHHMHSPGYSSTTYHKAEERFRCPCHYHSSENQVQEYGNSGYPMLVGHHHQHRRRHNHHDPAYYGGRLQSTTTMVELADDAQREEVVDENAYGYYPFRMVY